MSRPRETIGIGFIGAGDIAQIHKAALKKCGSARLVAVYDPNQERSAALASGTAARVCRTAEELVDLSEVDVVYVLTPLTAHFENTMLALERRKHTFVEKPVSLDKGEVERMISAARANGVMCVPGHNYIHSAALKNARDMIRDGRLGDVYGIWVLFMLSLPMEISSRIPGVLREVMIHHFYSLLFLCGRPDEVFAMASDPRGLGRHKEDQVSVVCRMPNGAIASLFGSFCADDLTANPWTVVFKAVGSKGSFSHSWSDSRVKHRPQPIWDLPSYWETFVEEDIYLLERCVREGESPLSSMEDVLVCLDMLAAAEASIESGRIHKLTE